MKGIPSWLAGLTKEWMSREMKNTAFSANILLGPLKTTAHDLIHPGLRMWPTGETTGRGHSLEHITCSGNSL